MEIIIAVTAGLFSLLGAFAGSASSKVLPNTALQGTLRDKAAQRR
jgi:hypothetical protein